MIINAEMQMVVYTKKYTPYVYKVDELNKQGNVNCFVKNIKNSSIMSVNDTG